MDNNSEMKKVTPGKIALAVAAVVVLAAALVAIVWTGFGAADTSVTTAEQVETLEATIPADGNPEDQTCKGSYTAADEAVIAAGDVVVATMGDYALTNSQLQVYYWMEVQSFMSAYGSYAAYFGLDYTQSLDTQVCGLTDTGETWQQFFLAGALNTWRSQQALSAEAEKAGFQLDAAMQEELDNLPEMLAQNAAMYGVETVEELLALNVGGAAAMEDYLHFMNQYYLGSAYYEAKMAEKTPTAEEVEAYFTENEQTYLESGLSREDKYVDVRHVLIMPEGADSSNIRSETFDDAAWEVSRIKAEELLAQWEQGDKSEDSFVTLAMENSQDGSAANGGLYTDVVKGQMVEAFENWCFDASRAYGDYGIVKTEFGYHIMFFVGSRPVWTDYAESDLINARASEMLSAIVEKYPLDANFGEMMLAYVDMTGGAAEEAETQMPAEPALNKENKPVLVIAGVSLAALMAVAVVLKKKEY